MCVFQVKRRKREQRETQRAVDGSSTPVAAQASAPSLRSRSYVIPGTRPRDQFDPSDSSRETLSSRRLDRGPTRSFGAIEEHGGGEDEGAGKDEGEGEGEGESRGEGEGESRGEGEGEGVGLEAGSSRRARSPASELSSDVITRKMSVCATTDPTSIEGASVHPLAPPGPPGTPAVFGFHSPRPRPPPRPYSRV